MKFLKIRHLNIFNKKGKSYFFIALTVIFINIASLVIIAAEEKEKTESSKSNLIQLNYYQGKLEQDFLPYYKQFEIVGSTKLPNIDADAVKLEIRLPGKKVRKLLKVKEKMIVKEGVDPCEVKKVKDEIDKLGRNGKEMETVYWIRGKDDKTSTFRLIVSPLTEWKGIYYLTLTFYDKPDKDNKFILRIVNNTLGKLEEILKKEKGLDSIQTSEKLQEVLDEEVNKISESDFHYLDMKEGKPEMKKRLPEFEFRNHPIIDNIMQAIESRDRLEKEKGDLTNSKKELSKYSEKEFKKLIEDLKESLKDAISQGIVAKFPYSSSDIGSLKVYIKFPEEVSKDEDFVKKFKDINTNKWIFKKISKESFDILFDLRSTFEKVYLVKNTQHRYNTKKSQATNDLERLLMNYYIENTRIFSNEVAFTSNETELDRIRFGLNYGIGGALLSLSKDAKLDAFSYVGVKYYLGPVDRRRPNPFLKKSSRWSLNIGAVFNSKITYKGQEQEDAFGGMIPMFGLGYELNSIFAINIGTLFFRQPSINPLSAKKDIKLAFYMGISYDFDLFNKIKGIIEPQK